MRFGQPGRVEKGSCPRVDGRVPRVRVSRHVNPRALRSCDWSPVGLVHILCACGVIGLVHILCDCEHLVA